MSFPASLLPLLPGRRLRPLPALRLVPDERRETVRRRRVDCARLARCEDEWIAASGEEQAMCPDPCGAFREVALCP